MFSYWLSIFYKFAVYSYEPITTFYSHTYATYGYVRPRSIPARADCGRFVPRISITYNFSFRSLVVHVAFDLRMWHT